MRERERVNGGKPRKAERSAASQHHNLQWSEGRGYTNKGQGTPGRSGRGVQRRYMTNAGPGIGHQHGDEGGDVGGKNVLARNDELWELGF